MMLASVSISRYNVLRIRCTACSLFLTSISLSDYSPMLHPFWQVFNKTTTRLGEALFLHFAPTPLHDHVWMMDKLGSWVDPLDTVYNGSLHQHGVRNGVRYGRDTWLMISYAIFIYLFQLYVVNQPRNKLFCDRYSGCIFGQSSHPHAARHNVSAASWATSWSSSWLWCAVDAGTQIVSETLLTSGMVTTHSQVFVTTHL